MQWIRYSIFAGVILISLALAFADPQRDLIFIVVVALGILALLLFFKYPSFGIAVLIFVSLLVPLELGTGTQTNLNPTVLLLPPLIGIWLLSHLTSPRKDRSISYRPILALIIFGFIVLLSFLQGSLLRFHGTNAPIRAQIGQLAIFILSIGAFLLMIFQLSSLRWLKYLVWLFLSLGGLYILSRLVPVLGHIVLPLFAIGSTGSLFWTWFVTISFSQAMFNKELHKGWRIAIGVLCILMLYISLTEGLHWASGWLPSLIAIIVVMYVRSPKLVLFASIVSIPLIVLQLSKIQEIILLNEGYSAVTRQAAWFNIIELIKQSPILGLGPANYYWYTASQPIMGWYVYFSSHNNYIDIIAQTGLIGFAFFIWFILEVARSGLRLRLKAPHGFTQAYVYGALGGLAGTLVAGFLGDWFLPFVYNIGLSGMRSSVLTWLFLGGLVGIPQMLRGSENPSMVEITQ